MGLDLELFEEEVPMDLVCVLCSKVLVNPVYSTCDHMVCAACLKRRLKAKASGRTCPTCNARLTSRTEAPSVPVKVRLLSLVIRCSHDCGKVCLLADLPEHVSEECPNAPVTCPNVKQGCHMKVRRVELDEHVEECDYRHVHCEACGQRIIFFDLFTHQSRKRCLEKKLRQQLIRASRETNQNVKQHRNYLERQHIRLEQQQRQRFLDHFRQTTNASRLHQRHHLQSNGDTTNRSYNHDGSCNISEYNTPRGIILQASTRGDYDSPRTVVHTSAARDESSSCLNDVSSSRSHVDVTPVTRDVFLTTQPAMTPDDGDVTIESELAPNTPSPSRASMAISTCRNCKKKFRDNSNTPHSCRWHPGPTCYACGRLDYQKGCMMGYHEL